MRVRHPTCTSNKGLGHVNSKNDPALYCIVNIVWYSVSNDVVIEECEELNGCLKCFNNCFK